VTSGASAESGSTKRERASTYHSPLRARQAAETRRTIIEAAIELFRQRGWTATTLPQVAQRAGTAVDTVSSVFGSKVGLLMTVVDVAIVGDDEEAAMVDRPDFAEIARGTRAERVRTGVHYAMNVYERSVPILRTLQEAAASDATAHARLVQYDEDRRTLMAAGLALMIDEPASEDVIDAVWALVSPDVFALLTERRGWSLERTELWFTDMLIAAIDRTPVS
jgi:AcrR family transcriptional regulator